MEEFREMLYEISACGEIDNLSHLGFNLLEMCNSKENHIVEYVKKLQDKSIDFKTRYEGLRYLQYIPNKNYKEYCISVIKCIIDDDTISWKDKFYMFSNNEAYMKLDYFLVNYSYKYLFENQLYSGTLPIEYKLYVAKFALQNFQINTYDVNKLQSWILSLAKDEKNPFNIRAECADILYSFGYNIPHHIEMNAKQEGEKLLNEFSTMDSSSVKHFTIYNNSQNVHDKTINRQVVVSLKNLISESFNIPHYNMDDIYETLLKIDKSISPVIQRLIVDPSKYENRRLSDVLKIVWHRIQINPCREELEKILVEEMKQMDGTCTTGYLSRLINTLSGFDSLVKINMSSYDEMKACVYSRLNCLLSHYDKRDLVLNEIGTEITLEINKFMDYIIKNGFIEELKKEYKIFMNEERIEINVKELMNKYFEIENELYYE